MWQIYALQNDSLVYTDLWLVKKWKHITCLLKNRLTVTAKYGKKNKSKCTTSCWSLHNIKLFVHTIYCTCWLENEINWTICDNLVDFRLVDDRQRCDLTMEYTNAQHFWVADLNDVSNSAPVMVSYLKPYLHLGANNWYKFLVTMSFLQIIRLVICRL